MFKFDEFVIAGVYVYTRYTADAPLVFTDVGA